MKTKVAIVFAPPSPYRVDLIAHMQKKYQNYEFCFFYGEKVNTREWDIEFDKLQKSVEVPLKALCWKGRTDQRIKVYASKVDRFLDEFNPNVIIASEYNALSLDSLRWARKYKVPFISWTDGTPHSERNISIIQKMQRRYVFKRARSFIASSIKSKELQMKYGAKEENIFISTLTVDVDKYLCNHVTNSVPIFVFVGALVKRKGLDLLINALKKIRDEAFILRVVGSGDERDSLMKQVKAQGLDGRVEFKGFIATDDMKAVYEGADAFILPTREDCFGLVILEAMCAGLPVFVSKYADGAYDLVEQGVNGIVFDPYDTDYLAEILKEYITQPQKLIEMGQKSSERVTLFSLDNVSKPIIAAIDSVLNR